MDRREERRTFVPDAVARIESRADGKKVVVGYAGVFYKSSDPGTQYDVFHDGTWLERIMPGTFDRALRERHDVRGLFNHSPDHILGRTGPKTLTLSVDDKGLRYEIDPPDTQIGRDIMTSVERGDITGSSFSFVVQRRVFVEEGDVTIRQIEDVDLIDVGPVTFPAYEAADAGVAQRSLEDWRKRDRPHVESRRRKLSLLEREIELTE